MNPRIRILSSGEKWTNVMYVSSSARGRMTTDKLRESYDRGHIDIVNPGKLS